MRVVVILGIVASKVAAIVLLVIVGLGYLFFLSSHSPATHLYFIATSAALLLTVVSEPRLLGSRRFVVAFGCTCTVAVAFGTWRIWQHLTFFEGPNHVAAATEVALMITYAVSLLCSVYVHRASGGRTAA